MNRLKPSNISHRSLPLKPLLNVKVDELFLRWISSAYRDDLTANIERIKAARNTSNSTSKKPSSAKETLKASTDPSITRIAKEDGKPVLSPRRSLNASITNKRSDVDVPDGAPAREHLEKHKQHDDNAKKVTERPAVLIPQFYFPNGKPDTSSENRAFEKHVSHAYREANAKVLDLSQMAPVCKACGCPLYWKSLIFNKAVRKGFDAVSEYDVINMWRSIVSNNHDETSRFFALLAKSGKKFLEFNDFFPLLRDIVDTHPGLTFLREAPEFHTRYMNTVIARIFYTVNRSWSGKITANELRKSNFLEILSDLEDEPDINVVTDYFSYEHFYVIYCKFWELDTDHDLTIDRNDLARHSDGVLSSRLIDRVLSGAVTRWSDTTKRTGTMSYVDFVWFLISEEDKSTNTSIEYWFRCMDLDGDGYISLYEMEYFYEEQMRKLELLDIEALPFEDCACQMLDMIKPTNGDCISLMDLKKSQMAKIFFDTFLNIEKYLDHEQKDPFANNLLDGEEENSELPKQSGWDRYATEEYEILVAEEQANEKRSGLDGDQFFNDDLADPILQDELMKLGIVNDDPLNARFVGEAPQDGT